MDKWEMTAAYEAKTRDNLLLEGWEPFAVQKDNGDPDTTVWFRRKVRREIVSQPQPPADQL